jgi:hypothetical protein
MFDLIKEWKSEPGVDVVIQVKGKGKKSVPACWGTS